MKNFNNNEWLLTTDDELSLIVEYNNYIKETVNNSDFPPEVKFNMLDEYDVKRDILGWYLEIRVKEELNSKIYKCDFKTYAEYRAYKLQKERHIKLTQLLND